MKNSFLVILANLLMILSPCRGGITYEIIDLGTLGVDDTDSKAMHISASSNIVGTARVARVGYSFATLFDSSGSGNNQNLGKLIGSSSSIAYCSNNLGWAVGVSQEAGGSYDYHATLFDTTGNNQPIYLGTIGGPEGKAKSINDNGKIVGFSYPGDPGSTNPQATLFDESGGGNNIDLGMIPNGRRSIANSINNSNKIVGFVDTYGDGDHAVLFDETGGQNNISLGYGVANFINDFNQVVGESTGEATIFDITGMGNNITLGALPIYDSSVANCISDSGEIVGKAYYWQYSHEYSHAVLFDPSGEGNNIDLNNLINPASNWELLEATGINDDGWIIGIGINPAGDLHGFLLRILYADLDDNYSVDLVDYIIFASFWLNDCTVPEDCGPANINDSDNIVDLFDLKVLVDEWLLGK